MNFPACGCVDDVVPCVNVVSKAKEYDRITAGDPGTHPKIIMYDLLLKSNAYLISKLGELFEQNEYRKAKKKHFAYISEAIRWAKHGDISHDGRNDPKKKKPKYDDVCYSALVRLFQVMSSCDASTAEKAIQEWELCLLHRLNRHSYGHPLHSVNPRNGRAEGLRSEAELTKVKDRIINEDGFNAVKNAAAVMIYTLLNNDPPVEPRNTLGMHIEAAKRKEITPKVKKPNKPPESPRADIVSTNRFQQLENLDEDSISPLHSELPLRGINASSSESEFPLLTLNTPTSSRRRSR